MPRRFADGHNLALVILDIVVVQVALVVAIQLRAVLYGEPAQWLMPAIQLAAAAIWAVCLALVGVYAPQRTVRWSDELQRLLVGHGAATVILAATMYLGRAMLPRLAFAYFCALALAGLIGVRGLLSLWYRTRKEAPREVRRVLIIGANSIGQSIAEEYRRGHWAAVTLVGFLDDDPVMPCADPPGLPVLGRVEEILSVVARYRADEIVMALSPDTHRQLTELTKHLAGYPVRLRVLPEYLDASPRAAAPGTIGRAPTLAPGGPAIDRVQRLVKRAMDIVISALGLLLLAPVFLITAVAIRLEDGGPVLYWSQRVGEGGRLFQMLKFRSMVPQADKIHYLVAREDGCWHLAHKRADDIRVTRVGRFIRRASIDELPQLVNVLKGEMSMVGPRPELPELVARYEPWQCRRLAVPQGITGWWQVNGRSEHPMHLSCALDLYYIEHYSLWLDILVLWKTIGTVLRGRGAF